VYHYEGLLTAVTKRKLNTLQDPTGSPRLFSNEHFREKENAADRRKKWNENITEWTKKTLQKPRQLHSTVNC